MDINKVLEHFLSTEYKLGLSCGLLTKDKLFKENGLFSKNTQSKIFDKIGAEAVATDFSILLGCKTDSDEFNNNWNFKNQNGFYWIGPEDNLSNTCVVSNIGNKQNCTESALNIGSRPAFLYSKISALAKNKTIVSDGILRVEFGEYPQDAPKHIEQQVLDKLYSSNFLKKTGKKFTINKISDRNFIQIKQDVRFEPEVLEEYEFEGRKFVRVSTRSCVKNSKIQLSSGEEYKNNQTVWVEVKPITWLVDEKENIAVSEKIIFSGIPLTSVKKFDIYDFLRYTFSHQIIQNNNSFNKQNLEENKAKTI